MNAYLRLVAMGLAAICSSFALEVAAETATQSITVSARFTSSPADVLSFSVAGPGVSDSWNSPSGTSVETTPRVQNIKPYAAYTLTLSGLDSADEYDLTITPPLGFDVFITNPDETDLIARPSVFDKYMQGSSDVYQFLIARSAPAEPNAGFGQATSWGTDRPIWSVGLGELMNGRSAGSIQIRANSLSGLTFTPSDLIYTAMSEEVGVVLDGSGRIRQVNAPRGLADVTIDSSSSTKYYIAFYDWSQIGWPSGGVWTTSGSPMVTYTIEKNGTDSIDITKTVGSVYWKTRLTISGTTVTLYDWTKNALSPSDTTSIRKVVTTVSLSGSVETRIATEYGKTGTQWAASSSTRRKYQIYGTGSDQWGPVMTEQIDGYGYPNPLTTLYEYYISSSDGDGAFRQLKKVTRPDGGYTRFTYHNDFDKQGLIHQKFEPFEDANEAKVTTHLYTNANTGGQFLPSEIGTTINGSALGKATFSYEFPSLGLSTLRKTTTTAYSYSDGTPANDKTLQTESWDYTEDASDLARGQPYAVIMPDGTATSWGLTFNFVTARFERYAVRGFATAPSGYSSSLISSIPFSGSFSVGFKPLYVVPNQSTYEVSGRDLNGFPTSERTTVNTTGNTFETVGSRINYYDSQSRLYLVKEFEGGTTNSNIVYEATYEDGMLKAVGDKTGKWSTFTRDAMGRIATVLEEGVSATTVAGAGYDTPEIFDREILITYDGSNREVARDLRDVSTNETLSSDFSYDMAGRLVSKTKDCCDTVIYEYPAADEVKSINPDGGYVLENYYRDGSLSSRTGDAAPPLYRRSAVIVGKMATQTASVPFDFVGDYTGTNDWSLDWYDWLGRHRWLLKPTFDFATLGIGIAQVSDYNDKGQLEVRYTRTNFDSQDQLAPYRFVYNSLGQLSHEGYDIDGSGLSESSSSDRVTKQTQEYSKIGSYWWSVSKRFAFPTASSGAVKTSEKRVRASIVAGDLGCAVELDANDNATTTWTKVNRAHGIVANETQFDPYSTPAPFTKSVAVNKLGLAIRQTSASGSGATYSYDGLRRQTSVEGRDDVRRVLEYYSNTSRVRYVKEGNPLVTLAEYEYADARVSKLLRKNNAVSGGDEIVNYRYTKKGDLEYVWGNGADPVKRTYDDQRRVVEQRQYRDAIATYSDFSNPAKAYSQVGWSYESYTGLVASKTHYEGAAPRTETYAYNGIGKLKQRTRARGVYTEYGYSYGTVSSTGDLLSETHSDDTPDVAYRDYDRMGRLLRVADYTGGAIDAATGQVTPSTQDRVFSYSAQGGLALGSENLPDSFYGSGNDFAFAYQGTSTAEAKGRFKSFAYQGVTWGQTYQSSNGRVASATAAGSVGGSSFSHAFAYTYDTDSDHVELIDGGSCDQVRVYESWRENLLALATQWNSVSRATYLDMGRTTQSQLLDSTLYDTGGADTLNKKLLGSGGGHIDYHVAYDARGQVLSWDTTHFAGVESSYAWDQAGNPTSYDGAAFDVDSLNQLEPTASGDQYAYDLDGNQTKAHSWTYEYDANNRLKRASDILTTLVFKYDYLGRRVEKTVTVGVVFPATTTYKFAYQGMELAAELDAAGAIRKSFHWGPDKSDRRGGAGGPMGLLMWRDYVPATDKTYYPSYDLNGNLTGLLDDAGAYVAWYEYDAFGKPVAEGGPMKDANPIRFSTQYTDKETGLVYYGFRFYDPAQGRFLNRDPIGEAGGLNLYRFAGNDPANRNDAYGLSFNLLQWLGKVFGKRGINVPGPNSGNEDQAYADTVAAIARGVEQASDAQRAATRARDALGSVFDALRNGTYFSWSASYSYWTGTGTYLASSASGTNIVYQTERILAYSVGQSLLRSGTASNAVVGRLERQRGGFHSDYPMLASTELAIGTPTPQKLTVETVIVKSEEADFSAYPMLTRTGVFENSTGENRYIVQEQNIIPLLLPDGYTAFGVDGFVDPSRYNSGQDSYFRIRDGVFASIAQDGSVSIAYPGGVSSRFLQAIGGGWQTIPFTGTEDILLDQGILNRDP